VKGFSRTSSKTAGGQLPLMPAGMSGKARTRFSSPSKKVTEEVLSCSESGEIHQNFSV